MDAAHIVHILLVLIVANASLSDAQYYGNYYCRPGRDVVVHLFEWKWTDIERECAWLAQNNFCAVQVSPPSEHRIVTDPPYPWWQRYQPVSYKMNSRSGTEIQFRNMITACNNLGVYIYVDAIINHMTGPGSGIGSDGSSFDGDARQFPGVPYGPGDFHGFPACPTSDGGIWDWGDSIQVRNCMLVGLRDLTGGTNWVRDQTAAYMNKLIGWGVAGFRVDAAKHMWPNDLRETLNRLNFLPTQWFPANTRAYIYQEVIDGGGCCGSGEYTPIGRVTEFRHGNNLGNVVRKNGGQRMAYLSNYGQSWGQVNALDAFVFIDNHDTQRTGNLNTVLTFHESNMYKIANAFQLAWQYGHVRIMSSYYWQRDIHGGHDNNEWVGPPSNGGGSTKDVVCFNGEWICEHRWRQIFNMVRFHNVALGYPVSHWWDNGMDQIAFGRSGRAFIAFNNEGSSLTRTFSTGLPAGQYCDVITCDNNRPPCGNAGGSCRSVINVDGSGLATFTVPSGEDPMVAIHQ